MAVVSRLCHFLLLLRQYLSAIARLSRQKWSTFLRRLFRVWAFGRIWRSKGDRNGRAEKGESTFVPAKGDSLVIGYDLAKKSDSSREENLVVIDRLPKPYTLIKNGAAVSLRNVAASSVYGEGFRSRSRSRVDLAAQTEAHERRISHSRHNSRHNSPAQFLHTLPSNKSFEFMPSNSHYASSQYSTHSPRRVQVDLSPLYPQAVLPEESPYGSVLLGAPGRDHNFTPRSEILDSFPEKDVQVPVPEHSSTPLDGIVPIMPTTLTRYEKKITTPRDNAPDNLILRPFDRTFALDTQPWQEFGWERKAHPEGARYFYHKEKRVFCDADFSEPEIFSRAQNDMEMILETAYSLTGIRLPDKQSHLVLDVNVSDSDSARDGLTSQYYFVDHSHRTIFFLEDFECGEMSTVLEVPGCRERSHLRQEIYSQYWLFVALYPDTEAVKLSPKLVSELRDMTHHCIGDLMTSPSAIAPYTLEQMEHIMNWTVSIDRNCASDFAQAGSLSLLARFMQNFYHARFCHFHGEGCARIERHNSVYGDSTNRRTWLIKIVAKFLFSAPDVHLRNLQQMWVDGIMHESVWEDSMEKLNEEWQEFVLFGTILLNANIGFLAIQSVDRDNENRSPAQIASYASVVTSVGSILLGLLLIRQNRTKLKKSASDMATYMLRKNHQLLGLETLAILHSLPYALLMWGMVSFLAAFCFHCFTDSSITVRSVVSSVGVAIAILVAWCIYNAWERQPVDNAINPRTDLDARLQRGAHQIIDTILRPARVFYEMIADTKKRGESEPKSERQRAAANGKSPRPDPLPLADNV